MREIFTGTNGRALTANEELEVRRLKSECEDLTEKIHSLLLPAYDKMVERGYSWEQLCR